MADYFGFPHILDYLSRLGLHLAQVDHDQQLIELAFHGNHGQWRMIIGIQQSGESRKLMLIAPHICTVTTKKRLECLEALMAVNYRIAMGKFGLDLEDGEVRVEEGIPLANDGITFEQFQLAFGAIMQTVAMYHELIPRIVYGNCTVDEALEACEQEFLEEINGTLEGDDETPTQPIPTEQYSEADEDLPELNVSDVLAEVTRMLEKHDE
jgi:hypothetical protein